MSTINVDNIAEYTSSGKINATHDIKLASGKNILDSSGNAVGGMVKVASSTISSAVATLALDDFVDHDKYSLYKIYTQMVLPSNDDLEMEAVFRSGGSSGADITGTYHRGGVGIYNDASGSTVFGNQSSSNVAKLTPTVGNHAGGALSQEMLFRAADGTNGITSIYVNQAYQLANNQCRNQITSHTLESQTACTGIKFKFESGNIASGKFTVYGVLL
tara:strand:- start:538 stop:1188 length:651 start_codon:yes stop_codon:yes gene_type:complete